MLDGIFENIPTTVGIIAVIWWRLRIIESRLDSMERAIRK